MGHVETYLRAAKGKWRL